VSSACSRGHGEMADSPACASWPLRVTLSIPLVWGALAYVFDLGWRCVCLGKGLASTSSASMIVHSFRLRE
jgi:hypothetical protein